MQLHASEEVRQLLERAAAISIREGRFYVGVEHLLAAVMDDMDRLPEAVRDALGDTLHMVRREAEQSAWTGQFASPTGEMFHTPRCIATLNRTAKIAAQFGHVPSQTLHVLIALFEDGRSVPARAMDRLHLDRASALVHLRAAAGQLGTRDAERAKPRTDAPPAPQAAAAPAIAAPSETAPASPAEVLASMTRNLSEAARENALEPTIGRDDEIFEVLQVLSRKTKNNVILVGDAGVGKTQLVEGLALKLAKEGKEAGLPPMEFLELNLSSLMQGTQFRGGFEEEVNTLVTYLKESKTTVLFIDNVHLIMGAGATEGDSMDLANLLKPVLARGEIRMIGATTLREYRRFVERDPAIERRFQMVRIEPLSEDAALEVLRRLRPGLEQHHRVKISNRALKSAVTLTQRYLPNIHLPDKAIDVVDQACAHHRLQALRAEKEGSSVDKGSAERVLPHDIRKIVSQRAGIPLDELTAEERRSLSGLDVWLNERLIGQDEAVSRVVAAIKKSRAGLADSERPDSVLLFLGPAGVGKTLLARLMADSVFGSDTHLVIFDMSEYSEERAVSRLLGPPHGYVGSEDEGRLTGVVRAKPYSILFFDEIEKAHPSIFDILLPIFDEGRLKDNRGREVSFRNCIIIMTSNVGAELLSDSAAPDLQQRLIEKLRGQFRPEFINRIERIVPFYPLLTEDIRKILRIEINTVRRRLQSKGISVHMYQRAYEHLSTLGYDESFGARELRRVVDEHVTRPISEMMLEGELKAGDAAEVLMEDGKLAIRKGAPRAQEEIT